MVIQDKKFGFSFLFNVPLMKNSPFLHISEKKNNCVSIYTQEFGPLIQCLFVCLFVYLFVCLFV